MNSPILSILRIVLRRTTVSSLLFNIPFQSTQFQIDILNRDPSESTERRRRRRDALVRRARHSWLHNHRADRHHGVLRVVLLFESCRQKRQRTDLFSIGALDGEDDVSVWSTACACTDGSCSTVSCCGTSVVE